LGGVCALKNAGCKKIIFGSECGDILKLKKAADVLTSTEFSEIVSKELESGVTFATARQSAAEILGVEKDLLEGANNNLGIEYIIAAKTLHYDVEFITVKRIGAAHDSKIEAEFVSASLLREKLKEKDYLFCEKYMSREILDLFEYENLSDIENIETAILASLRTKAQKDFKNLPDLSEGVENKLFCGIGLATTLCELYNTVKVKRYTLARIRRLVLSTFLDFDNSLFLKPLPYLRVLGFSKQGETYIKGNFKNCPVPIINRTADVEKLDSFGKKVFETEARATDLYMLSLTKPQKCGLEYTSKIIKTEC
jgi:predicted nucleotidyltransferase